MKIAITEEQLDDVSEKLNWKHTTEDRINNVYSIKLFDENENMIGEIHYQQMDDDDTAQVQLAKVSKRNQGYGMLLYKILFEHLKDNGYYEVMSDDIITNDVVHHIWRKLGAGWDSNNKNYILTFD